MLQWRRVVWLSTLEWRSLQVSYSSSVIATRFRLMKGTIPRNEISAIMLITELAYVVRRVLGKRVKEVVYILDSIIALL